MDTPLVSIITPTYNHENYIVDCIKSVQSQTYSNWEMLIVNDGSKDGTKIVAENFLNDPSTADSRVFLFNRENVGIFRLSETYNFALAKAKGKYIAILEADDLWEPDKLERQVQSLEKDDTAVLAWGEVFTVSVDLSGIIGRHPVDDPAKSKFYSNTPPGSILNLLYFENYIPALTICIRRSALEKIGGFRQGFGLPLVDLPTLLELSLLGTFIFDKHLLGKWRTYPYQVTKTYPVEIIMGRYAAAKDHYERNKQYLNQIVGIDFRALQKYFESIIQIGYARSGRYKLIRKNFRGAREDYRKAIFYPGIANIVWRLRALIGYALSFFKTDVEWLARLLGKRAYR